MANILYYPQMSMYVKQTKELLPAADGNINMMRNTILEWKKYRPDDVFYILLPSELNFSDKLAKILPPGTNNAAPLFYDSYVVSARINRFNFPMNEISSILKNIKIDLLINDVIELTGNFKQMFRIEFNDSPKIISNIRHIDDVLNTSYMFRVLDGIIQSDLVTILSSTMHSKLELQLREMIGACKNILDKVKVFEPSISEAELFKYSMNAKQKDLNKVIITFPGRLSIGEERRTNWDKFTSAIWKLRQKRQDFEVYFTDPNNALDIGTEVSQWTKTIPKDRNTFLNLLNKTDIIVSLMDIEGFGGISIREGLLMDCMPIIPMAHEYKKMAPEHYLGYIYDAEVNQLVDALEWAIYKVKNREKPYDYRAYGKQFTVEEQFKKLLPKVEEVLNG
jgi:hypothetical protein